MNGQKKPRCPSWCDSPTIHLDDETASHAHDVLDAPEHGGLLVRIVQDVDDGTWIRPPSTELHAAVYAGSDSLEDLTADACRALARALTAAADQLDVIEHRRHEAAR